MSRSQHSDEATIREAWPRAQWMPWDACPVGQAVGIVNADNQASRSGVLVGVFEGTDAPNHDCPTCTCPPVPSPLNGYWLVRRDDGETEFVYPPQLVPIAEVTS